MTLSEISGSTHLLVPLVSVALRGVLLASLAGLALALFRVKNTSARLLVWKAVLCGALAIPLVGLVMPPVFVRGLPNLIGGEIAPRKALQPVTADSPEIAPTRLYVVGTTRQAPATARSAEVETGSRWNSLDWAGIGLGVYVLIASLLMVRFVIGLTLAHRLVSSSGKIREQRIAERVAASSRVCGLKSPPESAESKFLCVPVTVGVLRPTIMLPESWRKWDDAKLEAVIAHEMSHVARRDAITQQLSVLYRAIFWFSPLAWWLDRHLANLAEQASDEAALGCGADRNQYARTLLTFFEALHATPGRVWWQGVAMAKVGQAERRLERILAWKGTMGMRLRKSMMVAIVACVVPVVYLVASAQTSQENNQPAPAPAAPTAPAPAAKPAAGTPAPAAPAPPGPVDGVSTPAPGAVAPMAPPDPAVAPEGPEALEAPEAHGVGYSYSYGLDDQDRFVIASGKTDSLTMSGDIGDAHHVEKLRHKIAGDFIWFERDGNSYIIQDQATINRARQFFRGQEELGKKQEELGRQQEALGKQQEELSKKMEGVRVNVPEMTADLDKLKAELKALSSSATPEDLSRLQAELGELQARLGESQSRAGVEQSKFGDRMGALGAQQGELGQKQGELGRQQAELAEKATREMKRLLDESIKNGTAKPEEELVKSPTL